MKTGFWLKGGKGKLAGATVYSQNGETVMREVVTPTNPKTEKQIIQRIIMHTVMGAYSMMKEICDHSFEGFKKGQETMSYFLSQNVGFAREKVAGMQQQGINFINMYNFVPLKMKGFTPNQYQVSMGSLPQVACALMYEEQDRGFVPAITTNTYAYVINALGLQRGDQLTFLVIEGNNAGSFGQCQFKFARVILDPTNADFTQASLDVPFIGDDGKINLPSVRNEGNFRFTIDENGLSFRDVATGFCSACAVIVSRQVNDKWLRSTAYLTYQATEEYSLGECIDMAQNGTNSTIYAAADAYLNNAGQGGGAGAIDSGSENGGSSGGNSGTTPTPVSAAISNVSVGGTNMTQGTTLDKTVVDLPASVTVRAEGNNACADLRLSLRNNSTDEELATSVFTGGSATIQHAIAFNVIYKLVLIDANDQVVAQTGYSFRYLEDTGAGDFGG